MGGVSGVNGSMNNHTLPQQDLDSNNGAVSRVNGFINNRTLYQWNYSSTFKEMVGDVENSDVSMNIHTVYQWNGLKSLINYNDRNDIKMNDNL